MMIVVEVLRRPPSTRPSSDSQTRDQDDPTDVVERLVIRQPNIRAIHAQPSSAFHRQIIQLNCFKFNIQTPQRSITRSSATAKSTARPSCLVGVLYDISRRQTTANQPLV